MFKNKLQCCSASNVWRVIFILWIIFATIYVIIGEYNRVQNLVAQRAYNAGISSAVSQIITESQKCQPVPVNVDDLKASLINLDCLQKPATTEEGTK
jgi:hypothetical protein